MKDLKEVHSWSDFPLNLGLLDGDLHTCGRLADVTPDELGLVVGGEKE